MYALTDSAVSIAVSRREIGDDGKEYLVAPVSLLVPGVLCGSKGALYYPPDEVARNVGAWDGVPLTLGHPKRSGQSISAKAGGVKVGRVHSPAIRNGRLTAEGWFDIEAVRRSDPALLRSLERGDKIEVSTGLYTTDDPAPLGASHNGHAYDFIARNIRPDHLAILPDDVGACSVRDGCGVNNSAIDDEEFAREFAAIASYQITPNTEFLVDKLTAAGDDDVMPIANMDFGGDMTDDDARDENRKRLGTDPGKDKADDDELNRLLFGTHFAE